MNDTELLEALRASGSDGVFGLSHLPTFDEAQNHVGDRFHRVSGGFLDAEAYRARIRMVVEPFLHEASDRAACCSMILELENPDVNPALNGARVQIWPSTSIE